MSSELRPKKLRGSGGYIVGKISDEQQMKGNLGGPDLFLAPIGRLEAEVISKHFCNTCEKEFEGSPKIEFENPNEQVADNLILAERGQYICNSCDSTIAEYRDFKKQDEESEIGNAKSLDDVIQPVEQTVDSSPEPVLQEQVEPNFPSKDTTQAGTSTGVNSIEGLVVYDEDARKIGNAKQVGVDSNQSVVLLIIKNDGVEGSIPWNKIKKIGDVIILGNPEETPQTNESGKCSNCGFVNKEGSKFCEECGNKIQ